MQWMKKTGSRMAPKFLPCAGWWLVVPITGLGKTTRGPGMERKDLVLSVKNLRGL